LKGTTPDYQLAPANLPQVTHIAQSPPLPLLLLLLLLLLLRFYIMLPLPAGV
jgi:hypothetical protein